jgi:hypothetical protein
MLFSALCLFLFFYSLFRYISRATCIIRSPFISIATVRLRSRKQSKRLTNTVQQEVNEIVVCSFGLFLFGHCVVCPSIYSDYSFGIFKLFLKNVLVVRKSRAANK